VERIPFDTVTQSNIKYFTDALPKKNVISNNSSIIRNRISIKYKLTYTRLVSVLTNDDLVMYFGSEMSHDTFYINDHNV
jgi:hypothetical protein